MINKKLYLFFFISFGLISFFVLSLKFFSLPWVYIFLSLSAYVYVILKNINSVKAKIFLTNFCVFFVLIATIEFFVYHLSKPISQIGKKVEIKDNFGDRSFLVRDNNLGYIPNPSTVFKHVEYYTDGTQNSVYYSINENSLRRSIPEPIINNKYINSVVFFGCSYTFGEMVEDNETLPWQFAELEGYSRNVYNFGFEGWGPHQMLASLQGGRVRKIVLEEPNLIVFQGIIDHINRVTNDHSWIPNGPRYVIEDGNLVRKGNFNKGSFNNRLLNQFKKSSIFKLVLNSKYLQPSFEKKAQLFTEIIKESRDIILSEYDSAKFLVVMWADPNYSDAENRLILDLLNDKGIEVVEVANILTDIQNNPKKYEVPNNGHPNLLAFNKIASFLLQQE